MRASTRARSCALACVVCAVAYEELLLRMRTAARVPRALRVAFHQSACLCCVAPSAKDAWPHWPGRRCVCLLCRVCDITRLAPRAITALQQQPAPPQQPPAQLTGQVFARTRAGSWMHTDVVSTSTRCRQPLHSITTDRRRQQRVPTATEHIAVRAAPARMHPVHAAAHVARAAAAARRRVTSLRQSLPSRSSPSCCAPAPCSRCAAWGSRRCGGPGRRSRRSP